MKIFLIAILISLCSALYAQNCPKTPFENCLDPINVIRSEPGCHCFSCNSESGNLWMLCTSDLYAASFIGSKSKIKESFLVVEFHDYQTEKQMGRFTTPASDKLDPDYSDLLNLDKANPEIENIHANNTTAESSEQDENGG